MQLTVRQDRPGLKVAAGYVVVVATAAVVIAPSFGMALSTVPALIVAGLFWHLGKWSTWTLSPGAIAGEPIDDDAAILVFHTPEGFDVWFYGWELKRDLEPGEALAFAHSVGDAVKREVRVFSTGREYAVYAAEFLCRHQRSQAPEVLANVLPCAPRRRLSLNEMVCFIGDRALTLGTHTLRFDRVELAYDQIVQVFVVPFDDHAWMILLTDGPFYEFHVPLPRSSRSARYQRVVGELRWVAEQIRARVDDQPAGEVPEALSALRRRPA